MLVVISPAKRLDWSDRSVSMTTPDFLKEANTLASHARQLTLGKLKGLMDLSDDLARLNRDRFRNFDANPDADAQRPAVFAFAGDTYLGLEAQSMDQMALDYAQDHLRILSGLYGVLRPMDAIQPYRLEMGSRLKTRRGKNLYDFWRDVPAKSLNQTAEETGSNVLVNCASQEYFGAVDQKRLKPKLIETAFYEIKNGAPKMISFFAKKARGSMARFIVENRVRDVDGLKDFDLGGYTYDAKESTESRLVFSRQDTMAQPLKAAS